MISMKNKLVYLKIGIICLIIINIVSLAMLFLKRNTNQSTTKIDFCYSEEDSSYILVEKNDISQNLTSYLYKNNKNDFIGHIYEYGTNKELKLNDLIKEDKIEDFNKKINTLLYLKYPKFIADVLTSDNVKKTFLLRENELVIYYSEYEIEPGVEKLLYLTVNYNEIKDYVDFPMILDNDYEKENGYDYTNAKKSVAFTFDDSPNPNKTNKILNSLNDNHFHATFFVVGNKAIYNKDLLINIKNQGNEIGSHSYEHSNMSKMSDEELIADYNTMNTIYHNIFQEDLKLIRPPYGSLKAKQLNVVNASYILWSVDTNDWRYRNSDYIVNYVLDNIKDGDIILFHDSYDSTVQAIEKLLPILYSKGYQVMSVSELFKLKGIELENNKIYHNAN